MVLKLKLDKKSKQGRRCTWKYHECENLQFGSNKLFTLASHFRAWNLDKKKYVLHYAYNHTIKTRLSVEFKDLEK